MDLEEYNFCNEATYYSLLPEEEINYTEPASGKNYNIIKILATLQIL